MPFYMVQGTYTPEKWASMIANPQEGVCENTTRPVIERFGGTFERGFLTFGEYDVVVIYEAPDNVSASTISMTLGKTGGPFRAIKTTPLITTVDATTALETAQD